ncbi:hypothetical protein [Amycolatopsis pretoriensis]|nr:hypothetical protein [Amycolatopsis pretoriensis]
MTVALGRSSELPTIGGGCSGVFSEPSFAGCADVTFAFAVSF